MVPVWEGEQSRLPETSDVEEEPVFGTVREEVVDTNISRSQLFVTRIARVPCNLQYHSSLRSWPLGGR